MKSPTLNTRVLLGTAAAIVVGMASLVAFASPPRPARPPRPPSTTQGQSGKADRYSTLLKKLNVPRDRASYGDFYNWGYWRGTSYAGHSQLPPGYWVYVYPHWYIYRDKGGTPQTPRNWGPEQATGQPDTAGAGDITTAWASKTRDGGMEWLDLTYGQEIQPLGILVYETYNPGALCKVTTFNEQGDECILWEGDDPTGTDKNRGISVVPFQTELPISQVRIYIDSQRVRGWNEIDAVGLLDTKGLTHWAVHAAASSSYAD